MNNWHRWGTVWLAFRFGVLPPLLVPVMAWAEERLDRSELYAEIRDGLARESRQDVAAQDLRRGDYQLVKNIVDPDGFRTRIEEYFKFPKENTAEFLVFNTRTLADGTLRLDQSRDLLTLAKPHNKDLDVLGRAIDGVGGALEKPSNWLTGISFEATHTRTAGQTFDSKIAWKATLGEPVQVHESLFFKYDALERIIKAHTDVDVWYHQTADAKLTVSGAEGTRDKIRITAEIFPGQTTRDWNALWREYYPNTQSTLALGYEIDTRRANAEMIDRSVYPGFTRSFPDGPAVAHYINTWDFKDNTTLIERHRLHDNDGRLYTWAGYDSALEKGLGNKVNWTANWQATEFGKDSSGALRDIKNTTAFDALVTSQPTDQQQGQ